MKEEKKEELNKSAKKTIKKKIRLNLVSTLTKLAEEFGAGSQELLKKIEKESKKLAKVIANSIKPPVVKDGKSIEVTKNKSEDITVFNEKPNTVKPASKSPVVQNATKVAPNKSPVAKKDSKPTRLK